MNLVINSIREKKFSIKILSGKIRRHVPPWLFDVLIFTRYYFFKQNCGSISTPQALYSDGSWVNRSTTKDLLRIQDYFASAEKHYTYLQVGIGNSSFFEKVGPFSKKIIGITIVPEEIRFAEEKYKDLIGNKYSVYLMNKYSIDTSILSEKIDVIIDNDISAYACCKKHFDDMLSLYKTILSDNGCIIVGLLGLSYFDTGFGLTENLAQKYAERHGFSFKKQKYFYIFQK